jgi:hypothetical protein
MRAFLNEELNAITSRLAEAMLDRGAKISEKKTQHNEYYHQVNLFEYAIS